MKVSLAIWYNVLNLNKGGNKLCYKQKVKTTKPIKTWWR